MDNQKKQLLKLSLEYIGHRNIAVIDPVSLSRTSIVSSLTEMGLPIGQILSITTYEKAWAELSELESDKTPILCFIDYQLGPKFGIELIQNLKEENLAYDDTLFIVTTGDAKDVSVFQAIEEDVDGFLIKPFAKNALVDKFIKVVSSQLKSSTYKESLKMAHRQMRQEDFQGVVDTLEPAIDLHPRPSQACAYLGRASMGLGQWPQAKNWFVQGLSFNKINLRCLLGYSDLLEIQKDYENSFKVYQRVMDTFPLTPDRLKKAIRLIIRVGAFHNILDYHRRFLEFENRDTDLVEVMTAGLIVASEYHWQNQNGPVARELLQVAQKTADTSLKQQKRIASLANEYKMPDLIKKIMLEIEASDISTDYQVVKILSWLNSEPKLKIIGEIKKLFERDIKDPELYSLIIGLLWDENKTEDAKDFAYEGAKIYPSYKVQFLERVGESANG